MTAGQSHVSAEAGRTRAAQADSAPWGARHACAMPMLRVSLRVARRTSAPHSACTVRPVPAPTRSFIRRLGDRHESTTAHIEPSTASPRPVRHVAQGSIAAEVDGNRTRRTGIARPNRFEGGGAHQVPRHLPIVPRTLPADIGAATAGRHDAFATGVSARIRPPRTWRVRRHHTRHRPRSRRSPGRPRPAVPTRRRSLWRARWPVAAGRRPLAPLRGRTDR